jgi:hypothetical protein
VFAAGCHHQGNVSFYGIAWVTLTDEPGDFASYVINVDSLTLTRDDGQVFTAIATPETVDFTQLSHVAELWGSATIPDGTYVAATIVLDYTDALIYPLIAGAPHLAAIRDSATGTVPTTYSITVTFDPEHQLVVTPTYASTSAQLLPIDLNLAVSNRIDLSTDPATVTVNPFVTLGVLPDDGKLIRIRGPLINSSLDVDTYTVYERPFYDEVNNLGTVSIFNSPSTIFTLNGTTYTGLSGLTAMSKLSAGTTMTAAYTTFQPTFNPNYNSMQGKFNSVYVVAGSTLEDYYTEGIGGMVVARSGNTLSLLNSTLFLNTADTFTFEPAITNVIVGTGTIVTADGNATLPGVDYNSIGVGQQIEARGCYEIPASGVITLDSTGSSSSNNSCDAINTGSIRLLQTEAWGSVVSTSNGSLTMNLQTINNYPYQNLDFAGNGSSTGGTPTAASFVVNTGSLTLPAGLAVGDPVWIEGVVPGIGTAPPDFTAFAVNSEASVQAPFQAPAALPVLQTQLPVPASLQVIWWGSPSGTSSPFLSLSDSGLIVNLYGTNYYSGVIRIGPESIDLKSLPGSPQIVPTTAAVTNTFAPRYSVGNPANTTATVTTVTAATATNITSGTATYVNNVDVFSSFPSFVSEVGAMLPSGGLAQQFEATGVYDRATNTFTATSMNLVL